MDFKKFKETLGSSGPYLKTKDFEGGREVGLIPWLFNGEIITAMLHYEGWIWDDANGGQKKNKKKPVRFTFDQYSEGIDMSEFDWSVSSYQGKVSRDHPKGCIALLLKDIESGEVKLASFSQVTLCNSLMKYLDPDEKFYVKNIASKILVIGKENERTWTAVVKDDDNGVLDSFDDALSEFTFSWDNYIAGAKDVFENGDTYQDVLEAIGDKPKPANKKVTKPAAKKQEVKSKSKDEEAEEEVLADTWHKVKSPKGRLLGDFTTKELYDLSSFLEDNKKTDTVLYKAAAYGLKVKKEEDGLDEDDIPF